MIVYKTKSAATAARLRYERTIPSYQHAESCLYSDGLIIPASACTCKRRRVGWRNVFATAPDETAHYRAR